MVATWILAAFLAAQTFATSSGSVHDPSAAGTFWTQYRGYIVVALAAFGVETALIAGLLLQRSRRRRAEVAWRVSVSERRRAEDQLRATDEALHESYAQVADLSGRLIAAQEAERKRIARDLHDDLSQKLALLSIDIGQLPRHVMTADELAARVRLISDRAAEIASDVHHLSYQLHPSKLESLGLVAAIQSICRDISVQHDLEVEFEHRHVPKVLPPDIALCLYRIVQEGLQNIVKHSGARAAAVQLVARDGMLELHVADAGVGFAMTAMNRGGIGLVSMRERVNFAGGTLVIHSAPGAGTRIGVRLPVTGELAERQSAPILLEHSPATLHGSDAHSIAPGRSPAGSA